MRVVWLLATLVATGAGALLLAPAVLPSAPAAARLGAVTVAVTGHTIEELRDRRRLHVFVTVASQRDVEDCLAFALDEPFATRRLVPEPEACVRPRIGRQSVALVLDRLTEDDLDFPSHTVVWGLAGGRCGLVLQATGVCVVEVAGTAPLELPVRTILPTFAPIGSLGPLYSFPPIDYTP